MVIIFRFKCTGDLNEYIPHKNTKIDGQIIIAGELIVKAKYLSSMQVDTNCYWNQQPKKHVIKVPTRTILQVHVC